jgi:hypothetical protein
VQEKFEHMTNGFSQMGRSDVAASLPGPQQRTSTLLFPGRDSGLCKSVRTRAQYRKDRSVISPQPKAGRNPPDQQPPLAAFEHDVRYKDIALERVLDRHCIGVFCWQHPGGDCVPNSSSLADIDSTNQPMGLDASCSHGKARCVRVIPPQVVLFIWSSVVELHASDQSTITVQAAVC